MISLLPVSGGAVQTHPVAQVAAFLTDRAR